MKTDARTHGRADAPLRVGAAAALVVVAGLASVATPGAAQRMPARIVMGAPGPGGAPAWPPREPATDGGKPATAFRNAVLFGALGSVAGAATGFGGAWLLDRGFGTGQAPAFVGVIAGSVAGTALGTRVGVRLAGADARSYWRHLGGAAVGLLAGAAAATALNGTAGEVAALAAFPLVQAAVSALLVVRR